MTAGASRGLSRFIHRAMFSAPGGEDRPSRNLLQRAFESLEHRRAVRIARRLRKHLRPGETVLDLGCGSLRVAAEIEKKVPVRAVGLETMVHRRSAIPLVLFAGGQAPFKDRSFDCVLIGFVLHHCHDGGIEVLREARRLAREKILLLEDRYDNAWERVITRLADKTLNWMENPDTPTPCRFRSSEEWQALFRHLELRLVATETMRTTPVMETRQLLFVLKP